MTLPKRSLASTFTEGFELLPLPPNNGNNIRPRFSAVSHLVHEAELRKVDGDAVNEAARAGAQEVRPDESGSSSGHVHDAGPGEIENTAVQEEVRFPGSV